jgi:pimeloyl-ACP methyl ester carboxylesterase
MIKADLGAVQLEYETHGSGEPVVLIHGSVIADAYTPLLAEPALAGFRLIRFRRRGFGGSTHTDPPVSIRQQAEDCVALMRRLGVERAHLAGHSYGGAIALQLALDHPEMVGSLALLEPALIGLIPNAAAFMEVMAPIVKRYSDGDKHGAIDDFMMMNGGPDSRRILDSVPGAYNMALADTDNFFRVELPALSEWRFTSDDAGRIRQPVLAMLGADTLPVFHEIHALVQSWLKQAQPVTIPGVNHMLQMMAARPVAEALAGFFKRNPMAER